MALHVMKLGPLSPEPLLVGRSQSERAGKPTEAKARQLKRRAEYLAETGRSEHPIVTWEEIQARRARA